MKSNYKERRNRRYYLHRKVRELGFRLDTKNGTVSLPPSITTTPIPKYVTMLADEFGYNLQYTIE